MIQVSENFRVALLPVALLGELQCVGLGIALAALPHGRLVKADLLLESQFKGGNGLQLGLLHLIFAK